MAQFDVHRNAGKHKGTIPYVVVVQSPPFDAYRRRVVVPLWSCIRWIWSLSPSSSSGRWSHP